MGHGGGGEDRDDGEREKNGRTGNKEEKQGNRQGRRIFNRKGNERNRIVIMEERKKDKLVGIGKG